MSFIGIITNKKNEGYIKNTLSEKFPKKNIIFITNKNIDNIKNIKFETIVIDNIISDIRTLKTIISKTSYVILNSDLSTDLGILETLNLVVISYGFNNKATFTVSSITEDNIIICLQRIMKNIFGEKYEPQEYEIELPTNIDIYAIIYIYIVKLIYEKSTAMIT